MRRNNPFPSQLEARAAEFGADYLISVAAWVLKNRPTSLRKVRADYRRLCVGLLRRIEQTHCDERR